MPTLPQFQHGDPYDKALNADFLNEVVRRLSQPNRLQTNIEDKSLTSTIEVLAINNTANYFDFGNVVTPIGVGLTIANETDRLKFQRKPLLDLDAPSSATDFPAVCLEPIRNYGGIGRVAIGGQAIAKINFSDAAHKYANPTSGSRTGTSSASQGYLRVLWKESGTGDKYAVVVFEQPGSGGGGGGGNTFKTDGKGIYAGVYSGPYIVPSGESWAGTAVIMAQGKSIYGTFGSFTLLTGTPRCQKITTSGTLTFSPLVTSPIVVYQGRPIESLEFTSLLQFSAVGPVTFVFDFPTTSGGDGFAAMQSSIINYEVT